MIQSVLLKVVLCAGLVGVVYGAYTHYSALRLELKINKQQLLIEKSLHETTKKTFLSFKKQTIEQQDKTRQAYTKLDYDYRLARKEVSDLEKMLSKHSFKHLLLNKPKMVVTRVNNATRKLFMDLEASSDISNNNTERDNKTDIPKTGKDASI